MRAACCPFRLWDAWVRGCHAGPGWGVLCCRGSVGRMVRGGMRSGRSMCMPGMSAVNVTNVGGVCVTHREVGMPTSHVPVTTGASDPTQKGKERGAEGPAHQAREVESLHR
jgi:hypothetical protein